MKDGGLLETASKEVTTFASKVGLSFSIMTLVSYTFLLKLPSHQ